MEKGPQMRILYVREREPYCIFSTFNYFRQYRDLKSEVQEPERFNNSASKSYGFVEVNVSDNFMYLITGRL